MNLSDHILNLRLALRGAREANENGDGATCQRQIDDADGLAREIVTYAGIGPGQRIIHDPDYGEEVEIGLLNGSAIRTAAGKPGQPLFGASYIRILNADGEDNGYWHCDEWEREPLPVMGAILASCAGRELRRKG